MLQILAAACLDADVLGHDVFFVQEGPDAVVQYEVHRDGRVEALTEALPLITVAASIEKFNHGYRLAQPIPVKSKAELKSYLGRFVPVTDTEAALRK